MNIQLSRPIISFDLETTGTDIKKDKIVSISAHKFLVDGTVEKKNYLINPVIPIPPPSTNVHGITDEMVKDKPQFKSLAKSMHDWFSDCDLMGFNIFDFDIPILAREFYDCGINWNPGNVVDVFTMEKKYNRHTLSETYKRYTGKTLDDAHNAEADNNATVEIFNEMIKRYTDIPSSVKEIHEMLFGDFQRADFAKCFYWNNDTLHWNINPKKGEPVNHMDSLVDWFISKDFPKQSKDILISYVKRMRNSK